MESRIFWKQLCNAVTCQEWKSLEQNDPALTIGQFNRETLLRMRDTEPPSFEISEASIQGLSALLQNYLDEYMMDRPEGRRWIILSCCYLALLQKRPMHPQTAVHWICRAENGRVSYLCPCKDSGKESVCTYCVCQKIIF